MIIAKIEKIDIKYDSRSHVTVEQLEKTHGMLGDNADYDNNFKAVIADSVFHAVQLLSAQILYWTQLKAIAPHICFSMRSGEVEDNAFWLNLSCISCTKYDVIMTDKISTDLPHETAETD